ncbi:plasmid stabilization protein [Pararoseomonas sp. SCSIO 73927]|uniref:FitA-like ribbon-helix-helix domain-containing protein n=1 Tax=Pararoseomonas sp. SCSIO 73927 TaxID=3114537 RepID=UPI0030CF3AA5
MGQLLVRNVDDEVIARLRARASAHGRSIEAEHREILRAALSDEAARRREVEALRAEFRRLQAEAPNRDGPTAEQMIREDRDSR